MGTQSLRIFILQNAAGGLAKTGHDIVHSDRRVAAHPVCGDFLTAKKCWQRRIVVRKRQHAPAVLRAARHKDAVRGLNAVLSERAEFHARAQNAETAQVG